jgi:hypothetical protein
MSETLARPAQSVRKLGVEEAREIGIEAYHYLYPLVLMHMTRRLAMNYPLGTKPGMGPEGMFHHIREFSPEVARPNFDVLCSFAWLDLNKGPYVISVPDTHGHYYVVSVHDMWTDVFASIGTRTSGSGAGHFAIASRNWNGTMPYGVERIEAPTNHVWIVARMQTNGAKDYASVHRIQDGFMLTPLAQWGRFVQPPMQRIDPAIDVETAPMAQVDAMTSASFYNWAADLMTVEGVHVADWPILARMRRLGLEPGRPFHLRKAPAAIQAGLAVAPEEGHRQLMATLPSLSPVVNGWQMNTSAVGSYGTDYLRRAIVAMTNFGAMLPEDSVSLVNVIASDGAPPSGKHRYLVHFEKDALPPVRAFWSLNMYDGEGFPARNPSSRFAIGDRDSLNYNHDGSLDIHVQKERPSADKVSNWLPSPEAAMALVLRLYSPRAEALDGRWLPPTIQRLSDGPEEG